MLVQIENLGASTTPDFANVGPATSFVSASWTPPPSGLLAAWVTAAREAGDGASAPSSVVGNSLAWSVAGPPIQLAADAPAASLVVADAAGSTTGTTTFNFPVSMNRFMVVFARATRADLSAGAVAAIVRRPFAFGFGTSSDLVIPAPYSPHNGQIACLYRDVLDPASVPGDWELMDDLTTTAPDQGFSSMRPTVDAYQSSVQVEWFTNEADWIALAAEIKAEPAGTRIQYPAVY